MLMHFVMFVVTRNLLAFVAPEYIVCSNAASAGAAKCHISWLPLLLGIPWKATDFIQKSFQGEERP
jgi:hypothetical protein